MSEIKTGRYEHALQRAEAIRAYRHIRKELSSTAQPGTPQYNDLEAQAARLRVQFSL